MKYFRKIAILLMAIALAFTSVDASLFAVSGDEVTHAEVYFVNVAQNKIVTLDGTRNNPIDVATMYEGPERVPDNGWFTTYYGTYEDNEVVNFTCKGANTSWKADGDKVWQIASRTNPSGWESVTLLHNDDGTVSFRSNAGGKNVLTIKNNQLAISSIKEDGQITDNEKFRVFTKTEPKAGAFVRVSNVSGNTMDVSWTSKKEHMYSCYEVLYSTSRDGEYTSAGMTAGSSMTIEDLAVNTHYYVKVRTLTNRLDTEYSVFSDSAIAEATTLKNLKPLKTKITEVKRSDDGKFTVSWNPSLNSDYYKVLRGKGRYGDFEEIGTTEDCSFVDENPFEGSKYSNYYKVVGVNEEETGPESDPSGLETEMFGENTMIFSEYDTPSKMDAQVNEVYTKQFGSQFGNGRYQFFFKPDVTGDGVGNYSAMRPMKVAYYTGIAGLGTVPYDVKINNIHVPAELSDYNATCNFWDALENLTVGTEGNSLGVGTGCWTETDFMWAVSQAAPVRRIVCDRTAHFDWNYGWASGGFVSDSIFNAKAGSYPQQQYYYRNCRFNPSVVDSIYGVNWNQVIQGCEGVNKAACKDNSNKPFNLGKDLLSGFGDSNWASRGCTTVLDKTDKTREKPFLYFDTEADEYKVFVPSVRRDSTGVSYTSTNPGAGKSIGIDKFFIAKPGDSAELINEKLAKGFNLILQPGIYKLEAPLQITHENTIVLGLGLATIQTVEDNDDTFIRVSGKNKKDIGGVEIAGIILDAGYYTDSLIELGTEGVNVDHSNNPCVLQDVICRVGGTGTLGRTKQCMVINSNDTIIDQTWVWRADHGGMTGWNQNTSENGIVVNGDDVTAYGLFVEHFQKYDIIWRGENGKTYFLQNEKCYDPQNQDEWMSHDGTKKGYAAYKVTDNVKKHYAVGLGVYDVFINTNGASIFLDNAIEVPHSPDVMIENACTVEIANADGPVVGVNHIINDRGAAIRTGAEAGDKKGYVIQRILDYVGGTVTELPDAYDKNDQFDANGLISNTTIAEGNLPTVDEDAEKVIVKDKKTIDTSTPLDDCDDAYFDNKIATDTKEWDDGHKKPETTKKIQSTTKKTKKVAKPAKVKIKKAKKKAKKLSIVLKKAKGAKKYQVAVYKSKKTAKKNKKAIIKRTTKKLKFTIKSKKLKKKKLFVRARGINYNAKGKKQYGKWSGIKRVKK